MLFRSYDSISLWIPGCCLIMLAVSPWDFLFLVRTLYERLYASAPVAPFAISLANFRCLGVSSVLLCPSSALSGRDSKASCACLRFMSDALRAYLQVEYIIGRSYHAPSPIGKYHRATPLTPVNVYRDTLSRSTQQHPQPNTQEHEMNEYDAVAAGEQCPDCGSTDTESNGSTEYRCVE